VTYSHELIDHELLPELFLGAKQLWLVLLCSACRMCFTHLLQAYFSSTSQTGH
jgi:hypothetical protein